MSQNTNNSSRQPRLKLEQKSRALVKGGYAGLHHTAEQIANYIPLCMTYNEPFAGLGRVAKLVTAEQIILNDRSEYSNVFCKQEFPDAVITNEDFEDCIKRWDSKDTFFLIDPPWSYRNYRDNPKAFADRNPLAYYKKLFEILPDLKGDWILCCDKDEHEIGKICTKSQYPNLILKTDKKFIWNYIGVMLTSNKPFCYYKQQSGDSVY